MAHLLDTELGNYRLFRLLGRGGFASVYLGRHRYLNTLAAIKVMETHLDDQQIVQFQSEARTIAHLVHPHIVRVLEFGVEVGTPFLVMDYSPAGTLRARHPRGTQLPLGQVLPYVHQIAAALDYAHQNRLIHRDVKPENLLLGRADHLWLSDFGLATVAHSSSSLHTMEPAGTVVYMAPEQIQGKPRPASDQYSLAITVYEWLNGTPPFSGTTLEMVTQHMAAPPPPLAGIAPEVQDVLLTALAKDPGQRFPDVQSFADALQRASTSAAVFTPALQQANTPAAVFVPVLQQGNTPTAAFTPALTPQAGAAPAQEDSSPEQGAIAAPAALPLSEISTQPPLQAHPLSPLPPARLPARAAPPQKRSFSRRWLIAAAAALVLLLVGGLVLSQAGFLGTGGSLSAAATQNPAAGKTASGATAQAGQTTTPGIPGATGTAGAAPTGAPTGNPTPTTAGNPTATTPGASPTATPTTAPGALTASPLSFSFSLTLVNCLVQAPSKIVTLQNQGGSAVSWGASVENPAYLSVAPASGGLAAGKSTQITVTVICPAVSLNTVDHITLQWGGTPISIAVTLSIL
ncbi:MAG TPA: protein kinase [Ktedonobacterales bacterium]